MTLQEMIVFALEDLGNSPESIAKWYVEDFRRMRAHVHGSVGSQLRAIGVPQDRWPESTIDACLFTVLADLVRKNKT